MKADVAIIIVSFNSANRIGGCLESVFAQRIEVNQQVIVVDNNSGDGSVELVHSRFTEVELVRAGANLGFARGVNLGVTHADSEFILLLNPDTVILNHAVDAIVGFARRNPGHGLYGGRTFRSDGLLEPASCFGCPTLWSTAMFACGLSTLARGTRWLDPESLGAWQRDSTKLVGAISGCFLLVPRVVWDELGGMNGRFFMYGEDIDLALRARRAGYRPIICPDATLVHDLGQSSATATDKLLLLYQGKATLIRIHWLGIAKHLGLLLLAGGAGLRAVLSRFMTRRHGARTVGSWQTLWRQRGKWLQGYAANERETITGKSQGDAAPPCQ